MQALNIAVVPTQRGVKALRIHDSNVIEGEDVPHYWYSLDLVNSGPGSVTSSLLKTVRESVARNQDDELGRITLYIVLQNVQRS